MEQENEKLSVVDQAFRNIVLCCEKSCEKGVLKLLEAKLILESLEIVKKKLDEQKKVEEQK